MGDDEKEIVLAREEYLRERNGIVNGQLEAARSLDNALITLSAGAIAFSFATLIEFLPGQRGHIWIVFACLCFWVCIATVLISRWMSAQLWGNTVQRIDKLFRTQKIQEEPKQSKAYRARIQQLNLFSLAAFLVGTLFLGAFVVENMDRLGASTDNGSGQADRPTDPPKEDRGTVPPTDPVREGQKPDKGGDSDQSGSKSD